MATKSAPDSVDLKLSNYSTTAAMNGSIASANNATLVVGSARKEFCQERFLSGSGLCQEGILPGKVFVRKRALLGRNFVRKGFCQEAGSARKEFCQERFLSGSGLCQEGILPGKVFVRKRALPGRNSVSGMPATGGEPSSSSKGDTSRPSVRPHELLAPDAKAFEEAPPTPGHPSNLPRSKRGVKLDDSLPHFGVEEELLAAREPEKELGDEPLTSKDEEWTPSLREKLQQEANSEKHQLTHFLQEGKGSP